MYIELPKVLAQTVPMLSRFSGLSFWAIPGQQVVTWMKIDNQGLMTKLPLFLS